MGVTSEIRLQKDHSFHFACCFLFSLANLLWWNLVTLCWGPPGKELRENLAEHQWGTKALSSTDHEKLNSANNHMSELSSRSSLSFEVSNETTTLDNTFITA